MGSYHFVVGVGRIIEGIVQILLFEAVVVLSEFVQVDFSGVESQAAAPAIEIVLHSVTVSPQSFPFVFA
jgi:hypothetical protein